MPHFQTWELDSMTQDILSRPAILVTPSDNLILTKV
jgi:hypothetical protein